MSARDLPRAHVIRNDEEAVDVARDFAQRVAEGASERDRQAAHPYEQLEALRRSGLLGIRVPRAFGGAGVRHETVAEVFRLLSAADASIGQIPQNHFAFFELILQVGSSAQQRFFSEEVLHGARFGNAQTERGTPHAKAILTRLAPGSDGRPRLNGRKYYATGAISAQWIPVLAVEDAGGKQVMAFVPRHAPGLEVIDDWAAIGQRATASGTVTLQDVVVDPAHVVPHWRLFERPQVWAPVANLPHVAIDVGIAEAAFDDAVEFVRHRARPWWETGLQRAADDPLLLERVGRLGARLHAAQVLLRDAARALDAVPDPVDADAAGVVSLTVSLAKAYAGETALEIANELFALGGASSADPALNLDRHFRNARTHTLHDPNRWRWHRLGDHLLNQRLPPNTRSN